MTVGLKCHIDKRGGTTKAMLWWGGVLLRSTRLMSTTLLALRKGNAALTSCSSAQVDFILAFTSLICVSDTHYGVEVRFE